MLQFVDNESVGECPTSEHLRHTLHQFHHRLKMHCGLSIDCVDGECQHKEEMSYKEVLQKIWRLLWNKNEEGTEFTDSESMYMCKHHCVFYTDPQMA